MIATSNLVLVGFMGTGKSVVGRLAARALDRTFVDMDARIEAEMGMRIPEAFETRGEAWFRAVESRVAESLGKPSSLVVAAGGGVVLNADNVAALGRGGVVVCLVADPETLWNRVKHKTHRPLLQGEDPRGRLDALWAERKPLYEAFPHQVSTAGKTLPEAAEAVVREFEQALAGG